MRPDLAARYDLRVPRYTSYPTAPHFSADVAEADYRRWLSRIEKDDSLSLYFHIAYCRELCWFCGCHSSQTRDDAVLVDYLDALSAEIDLVGAVLGEKRRAASIHFGGGSPSILSPLQAKALFASIRRCFEIGANAEISIELDPRTTTKDLIQTLSQEGVTRASLGVQDFNPEVQRAIHRVQSFEQTAHVAGLLRTAGIGAINMDLLYGLPFQTLDRLLWTIDQTASLSPSRIALFGYAHVPWMKKNQRAIPEEALPGTEERWRLYEEAHKRLVETHGFVAIGLDHFAKPDDPLAKALSQRRLRRNFQGYTTDEATILLGFGASGIGFLPEGYVANEVEIQPYKDLVRSGRLATRRGVTLSPDDIVRRALIERLMCNMSLDVDEACRAFGVDPSLFDEALDRLEPMERDGLVIRKNRFVEITREGWPLVRAACSVFDRYLNNAEQRHSKSI